MAYESRLLKEESAGCLLCLDGPCTKACTCGLPVERILQSVRFENYQGAGNLLPPDHSCASCESRSCMSGGRKGKLYKPVDIPAVIGALQKTIVQTPDPEEDVYKRQGLMQSGGWKQISGKWYYFYADGSMAANTEIDGYQIGPDGARNS